MKLSHEAYDRITVIGVDGELTADQVGQFRKLIDQRIAEDAYDFVLDLSAAEFLDSEALEALLWMRDQADERLGQVRIAGASQNVSQILHVTRLDKQFDAHGDVDEALKSLR